MKEKIFAMKCRNSKCSAIIAYLGELGPGTFGLITDPDFEKRMSIKNSTMYIICPSCNKVNVLISTTENNLPIFKLIGIKEDVE
ncbi:MAG: hypothetical protein M1409_08310 [Actinobacteria bacterium]|nr:hypothetical protein [Actinomycetota bacterium]